MPLKLRKRKGSRNWWVRGTIRGVFVEETTGTDRREIAEQYRIRRENQLLSGGGDAPAALTFLAAAVSYLEVARDRRFVPKLVERFGARLVTDIRQDEIDRAARELYAEASPATRLRQVYTPMRAVMHHAGVERKINGPKGADKLPPVKWPSVDHATRFVAHCDDALRPLAVFLFATGARLGEALRLEWEDVDLGARRVAFRKTKNDEPRGVPLHAQAVAELANLKHRQGRVFRRADGEPWGVRWKVYDAWDVAIAAAKVPRFTPHGCRHAFAAWGRKQGWDLGALKALGGWKSDAMALRYGHINPDALAPEIDRLPDIGGVKKRDSRRPSR